MGTPNRLRLALAVFAFGTLALAAGLISGQAWATAVWPARTGPISYTFLASILAAFAVTALWIAASGNPGSMAALTITPTIALAGGAVVLVTRPTAAGSAPVFVVLALISLVTWLIVRRFKPIDSRRLPALVRVSFIVFAATLVLAGAALISGMPNILPWPVDAVTGPLIGCIFLGAAAMFLYGIVESTWTNGYPQLSGFLAYDVVLLPALITRTQTVPSEMAMSLAIYLAVVVYSALLAIIYVVLLPETRLKLA
jgi:hypothetical protein